MQKEWVATVRKNQDRGGGYHVLQLELPRRFPSSKAGAFLMMSVGAEPEILLRRPMAIYDFERSKSHSRLDVLYSVVGRGTRRMSELKKGTNLSLLGPLGNSFSKPEKKQKVAVVAGGIGIAPFLYWARQLNAGQKKQVEILLGFRHKSQLGIVRDFRSTGVAPITAVEGPGGKFRGTVLDLLNERHKERAFDQILTCGPEAMMDRVAEFAKKNEISCEMSLEAKMGCGLGVCLSCVTHDFSLVCQEGPIFCG